MNCAARLCRTETNKTFCDTHWDLVPREHRLKLAEAYRTPAWTETLVVVTQALYRIETAQRERAKNRPQIAFPKGDQDSGYDHRDSA